MKYLLITTALLCGCDSPADKRYSEKVRAAPTMPCQLYETDLYMVHVCEFPAATCYLIGPNISCVRKAP